MYARDKPFEVLATLVTDRLGTHADFPVLTFVSVAEDGRLLDETRSYAQLHANAQALARAFRRLGVGAGDNLALLMNNHPEFVECMIATTITGARFVPVDPRSMGAKLRFMLDHTDCKGVVCADYCLDALLAVLPGCPQLAWLMVVPTGAGTVMPALDAVRVCDIRDALLTPGEELPILAQSPDEPMYMMFTSGTTGYPKAVVHTHRDYMALARSLQRLGLKDDDKLYTGLSLTHVNAQNTLRNSLALAVPAVISRKFSKSRLWDILRRYRCTIFNLLGGMIPEIYAMPAQPDDADNPVRLIFSSGMPAHMWRDFERRFGVTLIEGYGATEGGGMSNPPGVGPVGSIGKPTGDWEAEILDANGSPCAAGVEGEICFRRRDGRPVVVRYYKNPEASHEKVREGWLHMGDLGHKDEQGWFYFHHRVGGGVRKDGNFVNTALVESVLSQSPLLQDVFVYGVATARNVSGEKTLVAAVVPADPGRFSEQDLLGWCRTQLERNDVPEIIQVLAEIPKTISEKPIESACIEKLREMAPQLAMQFEGSGRQ